MMSNAKTDSTIWARLAAEGERARRRTIAGLFEADPDRFRNMTLEAAGICLDTSKTTLTEETLKLLYEAAQGMSFEEARESLYSGARVNVTEGRAALHTALRDPSQTPLLVDGRDIRDEIEAVRTRMKAFSERFRSGAMTGMDGRPLRSVLSLGIGGSDLGPRMIVRALTPAERMSPVCFVANVDGGDIARALRRLDPRETLIIVASKTMSTQETIKNADTARQWMAAGGGEGAWTAQSAAVTARPDRARQLHVREENIFPFWDWVGGRYSLWSAIGLPVALACGWDDFDHLCRGAHEMDRHFRDASPEYNLPLRLALTGIWHRSILGMAAHAVIPYVEALEFLPAYLQQLEMESNGKSVTVDGMAVAAPTAPVIWGGVGTNGQHAYFQQLHQGTDPVSADFIGLSRPETDPGGHHRMLMANMFAQTEALARGRSREEAERALIAGGRTAEEAGRLSPHCTFAGNRPTVTLLLDRLGPESLGALIALYEHKVFAQSVIWDINAFDQWGVELGKELAGRLLAARSEDDLAPLSRGLVARYNAGARPEDRFGGKS